MLYIVSTPIGNLEDITFRAVKILKEVDAIAAEDTRTALILMKHYAIQKPLFSYHAHSNDTHLKNVIDKLKQGQNIALISEAGTPGISDPGFRLIHEAIGKRWSDPWPQCVFNRTRGIRASHGQIFVSRIFAS
jgi:16S rRNA (cytidine1402-2'-O)-methyltransferase